MNFKKYEALKDIPEYGVKKGDVFCETITNSEKIKINKKQNILVSISPFTKDFFKEIGEYSIKEHPDFDLIYKTICEQHVNIKKQLEELNKAADFCIKIIKIKENDGKNES